MAPEMQAMRHVLSPFAAGLGHGVPQLACRPGTVSCSVSNKQHMYSAAALRDGWMRRARSMQAEETEEDKAEAAAAAADSAATPAAAAEPKASTKEDTATPAHSELR